MREKIMIVGASGLVGQGLVHALHTNGYLVVATILNDQSYLPVRAIKMDLSSPDEVNKTIKAEKPDIIINVAGLIGFEKCEANPEKATELNVHGVESLLEVASSYNPLFIQFSTDAVFAGDDGMYMEDDVPNPGSIYGKTKLLADKLVDSSPLPSLIIRPSVVYGKYKYKQEGVRFIDSVIANLTKGSRFDAMIDTFNSPTFLDDLCEGILFLINRGANGTFHLSGSERLSKYDFALKIARQFGLDDTKINPIESKCLPNFSIYPKDTSLDISKIKQMGYMPCNVDEGLRRYTKNSK